MQPKGYSPEGLLAMDPLTRQINEGVRINNTKSSLGMLMNSKAEFHQGAVARVTVERGLDN